MYTCIYVCMYMCSMRRAACIYARTRSLTNTTRMVFAAANAYVYVCMHVCTYHTSPHRHNQHGICCSRDGHAVLYGDGCRRWRRCWRRGLQNQSQNSQHKALLICNCTQAHTCMHACVCVCIHIRTRTARGSDGIECLQGYLCVCVCA